VTYVTVSQKRQRELAGLYNCPLEEIRVIYNGVEPAELLGLTTTSWELAQRMDLLSNDLVLLMPVRVTQAKNIEYALKVIAALKAGGLQVKLVLTGPPDPHDEKSMVYFRSLQELRSQLNLEQEMRFVYESGLDPDEPNLISLDAVADLYRLADLMIMPSHREGFGMPVLEAGLLGLPVVVSDAVPAAGEIGGEEVMRFDPDLPPHALAEQIIAWSKDDHRLRLTRRIRQNFTWQAIFQRDIEPLLHQSDIA
jgi:glycosyltransferase involved in cell wall biosynthesis